MKIFQAASAFRLRTSPRFPCCTLRLLSTVLVVLFSCHLTAHEPDRDVFSREELELLKKYPLVRVGIDPDWPPFSFRDAEGKFQGVDLEFLDLLSARMGVRFEVFSEGSWDKVIRSAREGKYDILSSTAMTPERQKHFLFTEPYFDFVAAIITRQTEPFLIGLSQLEGKRVASPREHVTTEMLKRDYPGLQILETANTAGSLEMVSRGQADATMAQLVHASYLIRERGMTNLKVSGIVDGGYDLRFAVRPDWEEFILLMNKAIASVPQHEKAAILGRWIHVEREPWISWSEIRPYFLGSILLIVVIGAVLLSGNIIQQREIARRRKVESELKAVGENLLRANEDKNGMMQMVAHDLRNPLTGIIAGADLIRLELAGKAPDPVMDGLDEIVVLSERIQKMVEQLLTVTALESGRQTLKHENLDAVVVVQKIVETHRNKSSGKKTEIKTTYPDSDCRICCDQLSLERIVDNLLSNAIKFSPPGSVVEVIVERKETGLFLKIRDQGPGFTEEDKKLLFKKFSHLSARPTAGETSTGLGLAIVKALVVALKGEIHCESRIGQGTTFIVRLPP